MTGDKGLSIFLAILFGLSGLAILALTWLRPMGGVERVLSTGIGVGGTILSAARVRHITVRKSNSDSLVKVEAEAKR